MAIPSGSGTEVLKRDYVHGSSGAWTTVITGAANHIYTVLSVTFTEQAGNAEYIGLRVDISAAGSNQIYIISDSTLIPGYGAFVWNDRIVLTGTDKLEVYSSVGNVDIYVSYIDQDWS
jgi:hypothetical protein